MSVYEHIELCLYKIVYLLGMDCDLTITVFILCILDAIYAVNNDIDVKYWWFNYFKPQLNVYEYTFLFLVEY